MGYFRAFFLTCGLLCTPLFGTSIAEAQQLQKSGQRLKALELLTQTLEEAPSRDNLDKIAPMLVNILLSTSWSEQYYWAAKLSRAEKLIKRLTHFHIPHIAIAAQRAACELDWKAGARTQSIEAAHQALQRWSDSEHRLLLIEWLAQKYKSQFAQHPHDIQSLLAIMRLLHLHKSGFPNLPLSQTVPNPKALIEQRLHYLRQTVVLYKQRGLLQAATYMQQRITQEKQFWQQSFHTLYAS